MISLGTRQFLKKDIPKVISTKFQPFLNICTNSLIFLHLDLDYNLHKTFPFFKSLLLFSGLLANNNKQHSAKSSLTNYIMSSNILSYGLIIHLSQLISHYLFLYSFLLFFIFLCSKPINVNSTNSSTISFKNTEYSNAFLFTAAVLCQHKTWVYLDYLLDINQPWVLASSTRIISCSKEAGERLITLVIVRSSVVHPSLWNGIITDTVGSFDRYFLVLQLCAKSI